MQRDLWQVRTGWVYLLTIAILTAALIQLRTAAADENHPDARPVPMPNTEDLHHWQDSQRRLPQFAQPLDPQLQEMYQSLNQEAGKYWLGVECREAPPELKSQLGLTDDEGLLVVHLTAEGPAAKAGLKRHDVLVSAGDDKLKRVSDLIKAVNAADGKEMSFKIIRAGKEQTIPVTPAERPKENSQIIVRPGPGYMFAGGPPPELPDNVTVTVVRHGKDPAKVTVTRDDEKWELGEKELDKLPGDLRPLVIRIVSGWNSMPLPPTIYAPPGMRIEGVPNGNFHPLPPNGPRYFAPDRAPPPRDSGDSPPRDGNPPPPRDSENGPPPPAGPQPPHGPGFSGGFQSQMPPDQLRRELIDRLDRLDHRLDMLQDELRRLRNGASGGPPRMRPRDGNGPDSPPPRDDGSGGRPGMRGGPPGDGDHRGPPQEDQ